MSTHLARDGTVRQDHYGDGEQPWDAIVRLDWAPEFAAANVLKYLRRTKEPEHSLESARWYFARLVEMAGLARSGAAWALQLLLGELTEAERAKLP